MAEKPKSKVKPVGGPAAFAEAAECFLFFYYIYRKFAKLRTNDT